MSKTNFKRSSRISVHFGHLTRKWNPKMAPYIFMEKNGIHTIDLNKTVAKLDDASAALKHIAKSGRKSIVCSYQKTSKGNPFPCMHPRSICPTLQSYSRVY